MKLALQIKKKVRTGYKFGKEYPWSSCLPFFDNDMATLIHRPRFVTTHHCFKTPHVAIKAWCGNTFIGDKKFTFMEMPPKGGKLLCARCETNALAGGLPSADELAGYHVHLGKIKVIKTCCMDKE